MEHFYSPLPESALLPLEVSIVVHFQHSRPYVTTTCGRLAADVWHLFVLNLQEVPADDKKIRAACRVFSCLRRDEFFRHFIVPLSNLTDSLRAAAIGSFCGFCAQYRLDRSFTVMEYTTLALDLLNSEATVRSGVLFQFWSECIGRTLEPGPGFYSLHDILLRHRPAAPPVEEQAQSVVRSALTRSLEQSLRSNLYRLSQSACLQLKQLSLVPIQLAQRLPFPFSIRQPSDQPRWMKRCKASVTFHFLTNGRDPLERAANSFDRLASGMLLILCVVEDTADQCEAITTLVANAATTALDVPRFSDLLKTFSPSCEAALIRAALERCDALPLVMQRCALTIASTLMAGELDCLTDSNLRCIVRVFNNSPDGDLRNSVLNAIFASAKLRVRQRVDIPFSIGGSNDIDSVSQLQFKLEQQLMADLEAPLLSRWRMVILLRELLPHIRESSETQRFLHAGFPTEKGKYKDGTEFFKLLRQLVQLRLLTPSTERVRAFATIVEPDWNSKLVELLLSLISDAPSTAGHLPLMMDLSSPALLRDSKFRASLLQHLLRDDGEFCADITSRHCSVLGSLLHYQCVEVLPIICRARLRVKEPITQDLLKELVHASTLAANPHRLLCYDIVSDEARKAEDCGNNEEMRRYLTSISDDWLYERCGFDDAPSVQALRSRFPPSAQLQDALRRKAEAQEQMVRKKQEELRQREEAQKKEAEEAERRRQALIPVKDSTPQGDNGEKFQQVLHRQSGVTLPVRPAPLKEVVATAVNDDRAKRVQQRSAQHRMESTFVSRLQALGISNSEAITTVQTCLKPLKADGEPPSFEQVLECLVNKRVKCEDDSVVDALPPKESSTEKKEGLGFWDEVETEFRAELSGEGLPKEEGSTFHRRVADLLDLFDCSLQGETASFYGYKASSSDSEVDSAVEEERRKQLRRTGVPLDYIREHFTASWCRLRGFRDLNDVLGTLDSCGVLHRLDNDILDLTELGRLYHRRHFDINRTFVHLRWRGAQEVRRVMRAHRKSTRKALLQQSRIPLPPPNIPVIPAPYHTLHTFTASTMSPAPVAPGDKVPKKRKKRRVHSTETSSSDETSDATGGEGVARKTYRRKARLVEGRTAGDEISWRERFAGLKPQRGRTLINLWVVKVTILLCVVGLFTYLLISEVVS
jgi:hypothetical protein